MTQPKAAKQLSKFTPGPWVVVSGLPTLVNSGGMRQAREPYRSIASTHVYKGKTTPTDEANARLISHAPEMYELLELLDWFATWLTQEKSNIRPPHGDEWGTLVDKARRIIGEISGCDDLHREVSEGKQ